MKHGRLRYPFGPIKRWALIGVIALFLCSGVLTLRSLQQQQPPQYLDKSYPPSAGNRLPDKNTQQQLRSESARKKNFDAANLLRKRQIDKDSAALLNLTRELKIAIEQSDDDQPTADVLRKIELIEKMAHDIKEKMKLTVNGS